MAPFYKRKRRQTVSQCLLAEAVLPSRADMHVAGFYVCDVLDSVTKFIFQCDINPFLGYVYWDMRTVCAVFLAMPVEVMQRSWPCNALFL